MKSARIGFTFASMVEAVYDCLKHPGTTWTVLSASKAQGVEAVTQAQKIRELLGAVAQLYEEPFADELGVSSETQTRIEFENGSRIIVLPANPRTARGYPGNIILDEFAHQEHSYSIWAAASRQVALGHKLRALSTPNGEQGKFFELAREFGLIDGVPPKPNPIIKGPWSWHWVDARMAIAEGCPISLEEMAELYKGDAETMQQELFCIFLKAVGAWLPLELVAAAENTAATLDWPAGYQPTGPLFLGIDVARDGDRTFAWLDELVGDVSWQRIVLRLHNLPFFGKDGQPGQAELLLPWIERATRTAIDATGIGLGLFEYFDRECPGRVMGVNFAGSNDQGVKIKTDMALRLKRRFEQGKIRMAYDPEIRQELLAIKRETTASGVRFDAPRIEIEGPTAGGQKRKVYTHADGFWAKALAELAAESAPAAAFAAVEAEASWYRPAARGVMSAALGGEELSAPLLTRERESILTRRSLAWR